MCACPLNHLTEVTVSFNPLNYTVAEGNSVTLVVETDKDVDCPFTIEIMPIPVTASEWGRGRVRWVGQ